MRAILPTTDIAAIPAAPGLRARPARGVALGSFAELSRQKIVFDFQLTDLPVQNIDLRLGGVAPRHAAPLETAGGAIQQLLLPAIDLVRMNPEMTRQIGRRPVAFHRRQRYLRLERRVVPLPCLLHVLLPRYQRSLGAGLHLSQLSHFRGPAYSVRTTGVQLGWQAYPARSFIMAKEIFPRCEAPHTASGQTKIILPRSGGTHFQNRIGA